jgi:hypothetical protein
MLYRAYKAPIALMAVRMPEATAAGRENGPRGAGPGHDGVLIRPETPENMRSGMGPRGTSKS